MWKKLFSSLVKHPTQVSLARGYQNNPFLYTRQSLHVATPEKETAINETGSKAASQEDLFRYTSGRWLINEKDQLQQRYVKFDVDRLCHQASSLFSNATKCVRIVKLEGNFNKAFLLTMDDGNEVIARFPCPNAGPSSLTTASEVATLNFLRLYTSIRVPEVLAWSSDPANPVGAEYIIMEKIPGVALAERWETMNTLERYKVIGQIVEMEKELASLQFPAYGSLFLRESVPSEYRHYALPLALDPAKLFCVGPSCDRPMWHNCFADESKAVQDVGPWTSLSDFAQSIPQRELSLIENEEAEVQHHLNCFSERQSVNEYSDLLTKAKDILPILAQDPRVVKVARPVLWHTDLHLGNIFVSSDDPTTIEGIIDWQSTQIAPLFIQARFPEFLRPLKGYNPGTEVPSLPDNFEELDPEQKDRAIKNKTLAIQSKYYEMSCLAYNKHVHEAMDLDRRLWEPFTCCPLFLNGSLVPLRNSLIRIWQDWARLGLPGSCPIAFPDEVLNMHEEQVVKYQDMLYLRDIVKTQLCTDDTGWVPMERWEETNNMNQYLFDLYIETMSEELSPDAAAKTWPFPSTSLH